MHKLGVSTMNKASESYLSKMIEPEHRNKIKVTV